MREHIIFMVGYFVGHVGLFITALIANKLLYDDWWQFPCNREKK